jgi:Cu(I)/Ag(I) efflux system membrane fusion protein
MKKPFALIVVQVAVTLIAAGAGYWFAGSRSESSRTTSTSSVAKETAGRKILYWHDPMRPEQKFDKPGRSPFMDMDLVPVYADVAGPDAGGVAVSPRMAQSLGIRIAEVKSGSLDQRIEAVGSVGWNERAVVVVQTRSGGFVERLHARAPLDMVKRGAPLIELLAPDWAAAQEEYLLLSRNTSKEAEELVRAARQRLLLLGMSEEQIQRVEADGKPRTRITLYAPIDGAIAELSVREGMTVTSGAMLFRLVDLASVWVTAEIPEAQATWLRPGSGVQASVSAWPGEIFRGRVGAILPEVNAATRTLRARIELANPGAKLKPGMFATLVFTSGGKRKALIVPSEAVIRTGERSVVMQAEGENNFRVQQVEIGLDAHGETEILKGLAAGDKIVVSGQFLIDSEANLRASTTRAQDNPAAVVKLHQGRGTLVAIDTAEATISHEEIASANMGAMTMAYRLPAGGLPAGLKTGDRIRFEFTMNDQGEFRLTRIERDAGSTAAHGAHQ